MASVVAQEELSLVLEPATSFAAIAAVMAGLGLIQGPDDAITSPAIPGEREFAYWTASQGDERVHYSFNPVVHLRVLSFSGTKARGLRAQAAERLPTLDLDGIRLLLRSEDPREVLLGLFAAGELKAIALIADVEPLSIHTNRHISQAAGQAAETLGLALLAIGEERLAAEERRRPDRSAVFARLGDSETKRGLLVALLHGGEGADEEAAKVLRSALADADWRIRAAAMLIATRLGAVSVWQDIRRMEAPTTSREGLDGVQRSILRAARKAALAELAGEPLPAGEDEKTRLMRHLRNLLAGRPTEHRDEIAEWIESWLWTPD